MINSFSISFLFLRGHLQTGRWHSRRRKITYFLSTLSPHLCPSSRVLGVNRKWTDTRDKGEREDTFIWWLRNRTKGRDEETLNFTSFFHFWFTLEASFIGSLCPFHFGVLIVGLGNEEEIDKRKTPKWCISSFPSPSSFFSVSRLFPGDWQSKEGEGKKEERKERDVTWGWRMKTSTDGGE